MTNILNIFLPTIYSDAPSPWQCGFQDPATPVMEGIIDFYNDLFFFLVLIFIFVSFLLLRIITLFDQNVSKKSETFVHGTTVEIVWTLIPAFILMLVAIPSFSLLYSVDEIIDPTITLKIIGHQWYWSYEYSDFLTESGESIDFDSYMIPEEDLKKGSLRLLEVDNRVVLPVNTHIRLIVSAADVIHSWAVPSFGIKLDACPGRLNQTSLYVKREGVYFGQCSEICGVNHGFMPIVVQVVSLDEYINWISSHISN
jgi:cytochrome c oxidase subunit 2